MNNLPSYQTQFNKITEAYIKGEILPLNPSFCFCGTLAGGRGWQVESYHKGEKDLISCVTYNFDYTYEEFGEMEKALFSFFNESKDVKWVEPGIVEAHENYMLVKTGELPDYEEKLFNGMVAALEKLKEIHIRHGEVIDETPIFQKRKRKLF